MTDHRMVRTSSPHPSPVVQLQIVTYSSVTFAALSLKEAHSCKPTATCDLVVFWFFLQGDRG